MRDEIGKLIQMQPTRPVDQVVRAVLALVVPTGWGRPVGRIPRQTSIPRFAGRNLPAAPHRHVVGLWRGPILRGLLQIRSARAAGFSLAVRPACHCFGGRPR